MKIETKLALNNIKKNKRRTLYTTISLILCTALILTTILLISSIKKGVSENIDTEYNDYHVVLKDLSPERFNTIKNKSYIDKIYIQKSEDKHLEKVDSSFVPEDNITVYLKYKNTKKVFECTNDIIMELDLSELELMNINDNFKFNKKMLTVYGYIDVYISTTNNIPKCIMKVNYSYIINLMIVTIIVTFSALFIIVLYNAFLITINERKKEYAILNSVGGTEGQVLKMVFIEAILMGIIGIILGGALSIFFANVVLNNINNILNRAGYYFRLVFDIKYILLSLVIIAINIYMSILVPSVKASSTSVIQGIRNNTEIKNKKRKTVLEKILPIEGKVAIKNIKRNKSKYKLIIFLLVVCMTAFATISTYLKYEKETANIVTEYDVDAQIFFSEEYEDPFDGTLLKDYKSILKDYEIKYSKKIEYMEYREREHKAFLIEPTSSIITNNGVIKYKDNNQSIYMNLIALDDETYNKYIKQINANDGDIIIYNNILRLEQNNFENEERYSYYQALNPKSNLKLRLVSPIFIDKETYDYEEVIDFKTLSKNCVLTNEIIEGYKEVKTKITSVFPTLFINMETYNKLMEETYKYNQEKIIQNPEEKHMFWNVGSISRVKIKCDDIVEFKDYMENVIENQDSGIAFVEYYSLENQEKLIYISIIELILKVIMVAIVTIGTVSTINIMNASLIERKEDFNILYRMGATKGNVKKILIYECIYMFLKATVISIILSIPIIYKIIKHMENILLLNKLLVPFGSIAIFIAGMFAISLAITIFSTRMIKEE